MAKPFQGDRVGAVVFNALDDAHQCWVRLFDHIVRVLRHRAGEIRSGRRHLVQLHQSGSQTAPDVRAHEPGTDRDNECNHSERERMLFCHYATPKYASWLKTYI